MDVVTAFATLLRRIVFDVDEGDEVWLRRLAAVARQAGEPRVLVLLVRVEQQSAAPREFRGANGIPAKIRGV